MHVADVYFVRIVVRVYMGLKYMNMDGCFLKHQRIRKYY
jgi:hypothetical protein